MIQLRHIRYFIAVAEELHFSRAAQRLRIAQPPLSQQIRQLEETLGVELLSRTKRRVQLTAAGEVFLEECRILLAQLERAVQRTQRASRGEHGTLAIGFVSSASYSILPTVLQHFRVAFPSVHVILRELSAAQQVESFENRSIDIGIARSPVDSPYVELALTLREPLVVALSESHPLSRSDAIRASALAGEPFVLFPRPLAPGLYDEVIRLCREAGFSPKVVQEAIQMQTIVGLVAADIGVAIVPKSLENLRRVGVVYRPFEGSSPTSTILIVHRKPDASTIVRNFLEVLKATLSQPTTPFGTAVAPVIRSCKTSSI